MLFCYLLIFLKVNTSEKFLQEYQPFQTLSNSLDQNEAICKGYQQKEPVGKDIFSIESYRTLLSARCMLGNFFMDFFRLLTFIKINFFKKSFRNIFRV